MLNVEGFSQVQIEDTQEIIESWREKYTYNPEDCPSMTKNEYYNFLKRLIAKEQFEVLRGPLPCKESFQPHIVQMAPRGKSPRIKSFPEKLAEAIRKNEPSTLIHYHCHEQPNMSNPQYLPKLKKSLPPTRSASPEEKVDNSPLFKNNQRQMKKIYKVVKKLKSFPIKSWRREPVHLPKAKRTKYS